MLRVQIIITSFENKEEITSKIEKKKSWYTLRTFLYGPQKKKTKKLFNGRCLLDFDSEITSFRNGFLIVITVYHREIFKTKIKPFFHLCVSFFLLSTENEETTGTSTVGERKTHHHN
jgi:hypothetical protein